MMRQEKTGPPQIRSPRRTKIRRIVVWAIQAVLVVAIYVIAPLVFTLYPLLPNAAGFWPVLISLQAFVVLELGVIGILWLTTRKS